jgi:hypothetical protein
MARRGSVVRSIGVGFTIVVALAAIEDVSKLPIVVVAAVPTEVVYARGIFVRGLFGN